MPKLLTLLINLDGSRDRLDHATAQLTAAGLAFERFPAIEAFRLSKSASRRFSKR